MHSGEVASPVVGHHSTGYMDYQGILLRENGPLGFWCGVLLDSCFYRVLLGATSIFKKYQNYPCFFSVFVIGVRMGGS